MNNNSASSEKNIYHKNIFAIDSRQRDYSAYPNANNYHMLIPDRYNNVSSIELKAAMLPRTEYNINSSNNKIDMSVGDYISKIQVNNSRVYYKDSHRPAPTGTYNLQILNQNNGTGTGDDITLFINTNGNIEYITYNNTGSGYSSSLLPTVNIINHNVGSDAGEFQAFISVIVGVNYTATLREGQYVIGGNPQFYNSGNDGIVQSWTPSNLVCELENALSNAVLQNTDYCYKRKSCISLSDIDHTDDYPLLFTTRLMSQYPNIDTYSKTAPTNRTLENNYNTNSCKFNRMYFTNVLCFKIDNINVDANLGAYVVKDNDTFYDSNNVYYKILKHIVIPGTVPSYIVYCSLLNPPVVWDGLAEGECNVGNGNTQTYPGGPWAFRFDCNFCKWELMFATGDNNVINSATLLGFNKYNYSTNKSVNTNVIKVSNNSPALLTGNTLIPRGLTFSTENDYYLFGDPEYIVLSFRPKIGGNSISAINDRVDSNENSNINRVFACLIYDTVSPAVLQDVSSGSSDCVINSITSSNNKNLNTYMNYDNSFSEVKHLTGNSGSQNTSYNKPPGQLKAMKGADFDKKIVEFVKPIAELFDINIRFSKYMKGYSGSDEELYDFHGKEHLLLFEITTVDITKS